MTITRVAIIGAGLYGLAAARRLLEDKCFDEVSVFERHSCAGGLWHRSEYCRQSIANEQHSSDCEARQTVTYDGLEANTIKSMTSMRTTMYDPGVPLFPPQHEILAQLQSVANDLKSNIRYDSEVQSVTPDDSRSRHGWLLRIKHRSGPATTLFYDAVVVANGHHEKPRLPHIEGLDEWIRTSPREILHSSQYNNPSLFKNKKVLLIGNSASGIDISRQLLQATNTLVHVSQTRTSAYFSQIEGLVVHAGTVAVNFRKRSASFADKSSLEEVDFVILCTGYQYDMPFLEQLEGINISVDGIQGLDMHVLHPNFPSLAFVGLLEKVTPFSMAQSQAALLSTRWAAPSNVFSPTFVSGTRSKDMHILRSPADMDYANTIHGQWQILKAATFETAPPPFWGPREKWLRINTPLLKCLYDALGKDRHKIIAPEDLVAIGTD